MTANMDTGIKTHLDLAYYRDTLFRMPDEYFEHINAQAVIKIHQLCKLMGIRAVFSTWHQTHYNNLLRIQAQLPIILAPKPREQWKHLTPGRDKLHLGIESNCELAGLFKDLF
jgi:hypothetical protein